MTAGATNGAKGGGVQERLQIEGLASQGVSGVVLALAAGECVCLSGPSGAGKSVLLRAVADLAPHEGKVLLDGQEAATFRPADWRRQVGLLPAEPQWWAERIGEHFTTAPESLAALGLPAEALTWQVARCSTGERQRLALLRLLANTPRVLLLDEPTASLDPAAVARVEALIADYRRQQGAAVLWVSHDPAQIARIADRHFRVDHGHLEAA